MDHISTLCALSTIGIASSGLALGRVERTKQSILRRKTLPYDQPLPQLTESTPVDVRPETSRSGRPNPAGATWTLNENETGSDSSRGNQSQGPDLRRASLSFGAARFRRRGQTLTNPPLRIPENEPAESHSRRPSTGWLRRLSMASFQSESPLTNSPVTPSFSGSASPIFPRPQSQRRSPNKLVKRMSSQHSNVQPLFVNTSVSTTPGLRRPATSYQRSETMRLQSPLVTDFDSRFSDRYSVESPAIEEFEIQTQEDWKPYFHPRSEGLSEKLARKVPSTNPKAASVRRITSDQESLPALVLATTITTKAPAQLDQQTTPITPVVFRNPFQTETPAVDQITPLPTPPPEKRIHKHSYSLNDIEPKKIVVNTVTASGTPIIGRPRGGSLKRVKGRTFSIPRSELSRLEKAIPGSPPALPQRRNITDPSVFRRPHALSPPGLSLSSFGRESQAGPRSVSQDYTIGMSRQRPLTSDAVALSTWQHSCRPEGNTYSSLRRRPKRHSITASDPPSTVIGSDDTRVFTSSDEYETDMMTDYWDSIRTRGTNGDGVKGLRIETMFDKAGTQLSNEEVTTLEDLLPRGSFASRMERDPPLFSGSLLPAAPVHINDIASLSGDEDETCSMIGPLGGEKDGPYSPLAIPLSEQNCSGLPAMLSSSPSDELHVSQKMNIFDWSEQSRTDRDMSDSDARPRTVHGKQNGLDRGSRAACRKVPSAIHLRSQSVPVAREVAQSDSRQTSGKFGTWGLGSKGVSEDWDSDFDFEDDAEEATPSQDTKTTVSEGPSQIMAVPQAILERQASLRGQFGQVQELTLLVEELKRLRHQASVLGLLGGPSSELWKEAEGIVNLATIDEDEDRRSPPGSPSSLTFSFDDSDEEGLNVSSKYNSTASWQGSPPQPDSLSPPPFNPPKASHENSSQQESQLYGSPFQQLSKNSPKSKSVLDVLQPSQRPESSTLPRITPSSRSQKLPFDTSSLRDLVVRAGVVTRALKEVIRKAEGVDTNPEDVFPSDPPFRRIFDQPSQDDFADFEAQLAEMH
ncbi:uncharacterized protein N7484_008722 [Penicillium longicatenatum]|uniref:uncharacterized protein n=1 Tax=Penicillium longicatenatum TaxID=1561947 RepID=UPI002547E28B|nr:uncharacterized protein N7484_008722 [Penicillium longicatenatum]KAJ5635409.1 hypothetical protein N7484_008722 [Penicillium longicatenatum]